MTSGNTLKLEIEGKCGKSGSCNCKNKPGGIEANRETNPLYFRGFVALTHYSKEAFTLREWLGSNERLEGGEDIHDVKKVSVYYWDGDKNYDKPLLIEVKKGENVQATEYYYRYESSEPELGGQNEKVWKHHGHSGGLSLQDRLDDRNLARNGRIPFNIGWPENYLKFDSTASKGKGIQFVKSTTLSGSEYTFTTYKITDQNLKLSRVENDKEKIDIEIPPNTLDGIKLYSSPVNPNLPLMFELKSSNGGKSTFYTTKEENGQNSWTEVGDSKSQDFYSGEKNNPKPTDKLSEKLDEVLCSKGHVTIDLSYTKSRSGQPYCCEHHKGEKRVTVAEVSDPSRSSSITFYGHSITSPGLSLAGIYYKTNSGERKRIRIPDLQNSGNGSLKLYTFYDRSIPKLIYVDYTGTNQQGIRGWYKGNTTGDQWEKVLNAPSESPDDIKDGKEDFKRYVEELKCKGLLQECPQEKLESTPVVGREAGEGGAKASGSTAEGGSGEGARTISTGSGYYSWPFNWGPLTSKLRDFADDAILDPLASGIGRAMIFGPHHLFNGLLSVNETAKAIVELLPAVTDNGEAKVEGDAKPNTETTSPANTTPQEPASPATEETLSPESKPEQLSGVGEAGILAGAGYFFATSAGSGLTGFLGYKGYSFYKNFKGDPWVIRI